MYAHVFKLGDSPANLIKSTKVFRATPQGRRPGYRNRASLDSGTSGFSTLCINHYATRGGGTNTDRENHSAPLSLLPHPSTGLTKRGQAVCIFQLEHTNHSPPAPLIGGGKKGTTPILVSSPHTVTLRLSPPLRLGAAKSKTAHC